MRTVSRPPRSFRALAVTVLPFALVVACGSDDASSPDHADSAESPADPVAIDAGSGTGGTELPDPADEPPVDQAAVDEAAPSTAAVASFYDGSIDACALLDVDFLAANVEFEFGVSEWAPMESTAPGTCSWENPSKILTVSVYVHNADAFGTFDTVLTDLPDEHTAGTIPSPTDGVAWYNLDGDRIWKVYFPHGPHVVEVRQMPMMITIDDLVGIAEEVDTRLG